MAGGRGARKDPDLAQEGAAPQPEAGGAGTRVRGSGLRTEQPRRPCLPPTPRPRDPGGVSG